MSKSINFFSFISILSMLLLGEAKSHAGEAGGDGQIRCVITGNSVKHQYCATTYIEILANPYSYDGKRISFMAWVVKMDDVLIAFPSNESLNSADTVSSIVVKGNFDEALPAQQKGKVNEFTEPGKYMRISGVFHVNSARGQVLKSPDESRLGLLLYEDNL